MQNDFVEQIAETGQASIQALQKLGAIGTRAAHKLAELQYDFAALNFKSGIEQATLLTSTGNYQDLFAAESDFVGEYSSKAMGITNQTTEVLSQSCDEIIAWFEKGLNTACSKPATKRTGKKASVSE
jgi:hypothetical protein